MPKNLDSRAKAREKGVEDEALPIIEDAERYASLESVANTEGGKVLSAAAMEDTLNAIESLAGSFRTATHAELIAHCAVLSANLNIFRTLKNAHRNKTEARAALQALLDA